MSRLLPNARTITPWHVSPFLSTITAFAIVLGCRSENDRSARAQTVPTRSPSSETDSLSASFAVRRVWAGSDFDFYASSPSPDGRWMTWIDWSTGDLAVRDIATDSLHRLTDKGPWEKSSDYSDLGVFSPDGRNIAYAWYNDSIDDYELRLLDFHLDDNGIPKGSNYRTLTPQSWPIGWLPDGRILAYTYRPDGAVALILVTASDGSYQVLKSFDWREPHAVLSPDGRMIAYDRQPSVRSRDRDIYLVSVDGSRESTLVENDGNDVVLGWSPGRGDLLFYSNRTGNPSIWKLPMEDGKPAGPPILVREDMWNLEPLGLAGDALYLGVTVEQPVFRTATVDLTAGRLVPLPTVFDDPYGGRVRGLDWSPDGQYVVNEIVRPDPHGLVVSVRSADGEVVREWEFDLSMKRGGGRWTPDGRSVVLHARDSRGRPAFRRIDLESGEATTIREFRPPGEYYGRFALSPDGRSLYYSRAPVHDGVADMKAPEITIHDLATGAEQSIHRLEFGARMELSPDGAWLAFHEAFSPKAHRLWVMPSKGGEARVLFDTDLQVGTLAGIAGWTPDNRSILFLLNVAPSSDADDMELWCVSRQGGDARKIARLEDYARSEVRLHPNGRTLAYRAGKARGEIWVMENLVGSPNATGSGR